jgi:hypothetical protein
MEAMTFYAIRAVTLRIVASARKVREPGIHQDPVSMKASVACQPATLAGCGA